MKHIVKYTESQRGWGGEVWYTSYSSEYEANTATEDCMLRFAGNAVIPDYYIFAEYIGVWPSVPVGYKF